jgi:hypothetical protein
LSGESFYDHEVNKNGKKLREWQQMPYVSFIMSDKDVSYLEYYRFKNEVAKSD